MEQEADLPPMSVSQSDPSRDLSDIHLGRKRPRLEYDLATSSDPALFSSDDHAPTAETYASKRRKEQWHGTWWGGKLKDRASSASNGSKRKLSRNFDSGVWMGSDGTDTSHEDEILEDLRIANKQSSAASLPGIRSEKTFNGSGNHDPVSSDSDEYKLYQSRVSQISPDSGRVPSPHAAMETIIDRCLEAGDGNIDLSSLLLDQVSNGSLRRLRGFTKHTTIQDIPPSQEMYSPIEAELYLYLSNNSISRFPADILNLTNIRVLSLRHNRLTKIPPALARLSQLEQLNIAANELRCLPYEILRLYNSEHFDMILTPNPFEPIPSEQITHLKQNPGLVARSTRTYFHADGSRTADGALPAISRVSSLLELALQKCKVFPDLLDIKHWCSVGEGPEILTGPIDLAREAAEYGDLECTVCGRSFIIPRVQWLEWRTLPWEGRCILGSARTIVPFVRQACSPACVEELESLSQ